MSREAVDQWANAHGREDLGDGQRRERNDGRLSRDATARQEIEMNSSSPVPSAFTRDTVQKTDVRSASARVHAGSGVCRDR